MSPADTYRTDFRLQVPRGRFYDPQRNRLYRSVQTIPRRKESLLLYNRVWTGSTVALDGAQAGITRTTVKLPIISDYFSAPVQSVRRVINGRVDTFGTQYGGDPLNLALDENLVFRFFTDLRKLLSIQSRNAPFFKPGPNVRFSARMFYLTTEANQNNVIKTLWAPSSPTVLETLDYLEDEMITHISEYGNNLWFYDLRIVKDVFPQGIGQGSVFRSIRQIDQKYIRPFIFTRFNCAYVACAMHKRAQHDPSSLLLPVEIHREGGQNLKRRLRRSGAEAVHAMYSDFDTLRSIANYYRLPIKVYNNTFGVELDYQPPAMRRTGKARKSIELFLHDNHYYPLFERGAIPEDIVKQFDFVKNKMEFQENNTVTFQEKKKAVYDALARGECVKIDKEFNDDEEFDPKKIAAWDLETSPAIVHAVQEEHKVQKCYLAGFAYTNEADKQVCLQFEGEQCIQKMLKEMANRQRVLNKFVFYAHNSGRFDLPILLREGFFSKWTIDEDGNPWKIVPKRAMELNGGWISFAIELRESHRKTKMPVYITFRDSLRLMPDKLARLCKDFSTPHQKLGDVDHSEITLLNWNSEAYYEKVMRYHKNDVLGLLELVQMFGAEVQKEYKVDIRRCVTVASLAKRAFFKNWSHHEVFTMPEEYDQFIRNSYFGGRCEAFSIGQLHETNPPWTDGKVRSDKFYYYDFTSLYPWVCQAFELPVGEPKWCRTSDVFVDGKLRDDFYGFVMCNVQTRDGFMEKEQYDGYAPWRPVHPIVCNGRLTFPHLTAPVPMVIFSEEIRYCQENKFPYDYTFEESYRCVQFQKGHLLRNMIQEVYEKKKEATKLKHRGKRLITKLLLNSAYGFWGLKVRGRDSVLVINDKDREMTFHKYLESNKLLGCGTHSGGEDKYHFLRVLRDLDTTDFNVAVASAVTSFARIRLHQAITAFEAAHERARVYYCDTDSLITNVPITIDDNLVKQFQWNAETDSRDVDGIILGNLKNEGDDIVEDQLLAQREVEGEIGFNEAWVLGCKMYGLRKSNIVGGKSAEITKCKGYSQNDKDLEIADYISLVEHMDEVNSLYKKYLDREIDYAAFREHVKPFVIQQEQTQFRIGKHSFLSENAMAFSVEIKQVEKMFRSNYTKGILLPSNNIAPLEVTHNDWFTPSNNAALEAREQELEYAQQEEEREDAMPDDLEPWDMFDDDEMLIDEDLGIVVAHQYFEACD